MNSLKFNPGATDYDEQNALSLAHLSSLAYKEEGEIISTLDDWGFSKTHFLNNSETGTQGFIAADADILLLVFRGTQITRLEDLLTDARLVLVPGPFGTVHKGFLVALNSVWDEVEAKITEFQDNNQSILLSGHSLGAALATLAAARLGNQVNSSFQGLYTYGLPRVGNPEFISMFNAINQGRCFRVRNNNDVVTRIPVAGIFILRYRHVDALIYFDSDGKRRTSMTPQEMVMDRFKGRLEDVGRLGSDGLNDHRMSAYIELLEKDLDHQSTDM